MTDTGYRFFTVLQSNDPVLSTIRGKTVTDFLSIPPKAPPLTKDVSAAREAARELESSFLAEMLKGAGFGEQKNGFSGGVGEDQFASFHRQAVADEIAKTGGLGLAEHFFTAMMESRNEPQ
jgi:Rod binding domain-containing protein